MDAERVAEIRQAIAQGSFKIDPGKIADGLIESVRQMLAAQKK
jgi:negative regulator of flagellin synthesis FlgM